MDEGRGDLNSVLRWTSTNVVATKEVHPREIDISNQWDVWYRMTHIGSSRIISRATPFVRDIGTEV